MTLALVACSLLSFVFVAHRNGPPPPAEMHDARPLPALKSLPVSAIQRGAYALDSLASGNHVTVLGPAGNRPRVELPADAPATLSGWIYDQQSSSAPDAVLLLVDGKPVIAATGTSRADVQAALHLPIDNVGFTAKIPAVLLRPGLHTIVARIFDGQRTHATQLATTLIVDARAGLH